MSSDGERHAPTPCSTRASASSYRVPRSTPLDQVRQLEQRAAPLAQTGHRRGLGLDAHGVLDGLADQPVDDLGRQRDAGRRQAGADARGVHPAVRGRRHGALREPLRAHPVDDHRARPQARGLQLGHRLEGLGDGQVLQQRHQVHGGLRRVHQLHHALALAVDRAGAREVGHRPGHVEEADDAAGGRGVEDHGVVNGPSGQARARDALLGLAGEQDVAQPGGQRGGELDRAHPPQRPARRPRAGRTSRGTPAARPRDRRPAPAPRRRRARRRSAAPRRAAARCRTPARCPGGPPPRRAASGGRRWPAPVPAPRPPWSCRCRPCPRRRGGGPRTARAASRRNAPRQRMRGRGDRPLRAGEALTTVPA